MRKIFERKILGFLIFFVFLTAEICSAQNFNEISFVKMGGTKDELYDIFEIGSNTQSYTAKRWIFPFYINRYETTYAFWYRIRTAAEKRGYIFANPGQEGSEGRRGAPPTEKNRFQPVTMISWYDAVIWCNALSEQSGKNPCYTYEGKILRDSTETAKLDMANCNWDCNGYRLPTEAEWEYAARKTKSGFQSGALASGQVDSNGKDNQNIPEEEVAWISSNADKTRIVGTAGTPFFPDTPPAPASGNPNGAGLFDMSGNVNEFCWDWFGTYLDILPGTRAIGALSGSRRVSRGGSYSPYTPFFYCADRYAYDPNEVYDYMGFRIVTSK